MRTQKVDEEIYLAAQYSSSLGYIHQWSWEQWLDFLKDQHIIPILREHAGEVFLDVGCGGGWIAYMIKDGRQIYGIDLCKEAIEYAKQHNERGTFVEGDVCRGLPYADGFFDTVFMNGVLEQLIKHEFVVEECHRILKDGGKLIVGGVRINLPIESMRTLSFDTEEEAVSYAEEKGFSVQTLGGVDDKHITLICTKTKKPVVAPKKRRK